MSKQKINKVVLAYSGGLDTSVILKWLEDEYQCEVVTFTADIGQGEEVEPAREKAKQYGIREIYIEDIGQGEEVEPAREKAKQYGIREIYIEDLREEFVRDYVYPMFRANTIYEGEYLLGTSIARPLIAARERELNEQLGEENLERPMPFPTAPPARATTRCVSSWAPMR